MPMHQLLNVPDSIASWATTAGRTLEPAAGVKALGWTALYKAPSRWMNWIQNLLCEWSRVQARMAVANWFENDIAEANSVWSIIYHPDIGSWVHVVDAMIPNSYLTPSGHNWQAGGVLNSGAQFNSIAIDATNFLVGCAGGDIEYSATGAVWSTELSATIGGAGAIYSIATAYPTDDRTICIRTNAAPYIAATGVGGGWAAASTPPGALATPLRVLFLTGTTWAIFGGDGAHSNCKLYISSDDGDTWAASASDPSAGPSFYDMAYNPTTGRLVIVGEGVGGVTAEYTDDLGTTWSTATMNDIMPCKLYHVYYCGGGVWVSVGEYDASMLGRPNIHISTDDGETWEFAQGMTNGSMSTSDFYTIGCDGKIVIVGGENGENLFSLQAG